MIQKQPNAAQSKIYFSNQKEEFLTLTKLSSGKGFANLSKYFRVCSWLKPAPVFFTFLLSGHLTSYSQNNHFYYSFEDKVFLTPEPNKAVVEFIATVDESIFVQNGWSFNKISLRLYEVSGDLPTILSSGNIIYHANQSYLTESGTKYHMRNQIVIKWKESTTATQKQVLTTQYNLQMMKETRLFTIYETFNPLFISQNIYESGYTEYCVPNSVAYAEHNEHIPNDPYFVKQFYLKNTGQTYQYSSAEEGADMDVTEAWDVTMGDPEIVIAVIDEGVVASHGDLPLSRQIRLDGSNFTYSYDNSDADDPEPYVDVVGGIAEWHGTACAGLIAATIDNNEGIAGIAPLCHIMPIKVRFFVQPLTTDFALAVTFAVENGAKIISCSWGYANLEPNYDPVLIDAIEDAIASNIAVIFSAGNTSANGGNGAVKFPANAAIEGLITVSASTMSDDIADYSSVGETVDFAAPSATSSYTTPEIYTTDYPSTLGRNPWPESPTGLPYFLPNLNEEIPETGTNHLDYTGTFSGTSASCPMVAGVVALMLSVNQCLSVSSINDILRNTSEKVGGFNYNWNNDNPGHSLQFGYGRINAYQAVLASQSSLIDQEQNIYIKDLMTDYGQEPTTGDYNLWSSPDIYVRNQNDGFEIPVHQNPEYSPNSPVYVYVNVRNGGCESSGFGFVSLNWSKAGTDLDWPSYWDCSMTSPALMGCLIGTAPCVNIAPGEKQTLEFLWYPPNPADYGGLGIGVEDQPWHFCLLARYVSSYDPMTNEVENEIHNLHGNVKNNNNIAWKNLTVIDDFEGIVGRPWPNDKLVGANVAVGNSATTNEQYCLEFGPPISEEGQAITDIAKVRISLDETTWSAWQEGGAMAENMSIVSGERMQLEVTGHPAKMKNLVFDANERSAIHVGFNILSNASMEKNVYHYELIQRFRNSTLIIGGETFEIVPIQRHSFEAEAGSDISVEVGASFTLTAASIGEDAIYNWYKADGSLLHTGQQYDGQLQYSSNIKLEVIAASDGYVSFDEVSVEVFTPSIALITPNPGSGSIQIDFNHLISAQPMLIFTHCNSAEVHTRPLNPNETSCQTDISGFSVGQWCVQLIGDGVVYDQKFLLKF